ncbi:MAG: signal recognition particle-docking protein FtsY, partial [Marmoricola sp.]|nr:signal recognition particle-docking protein FtsY [Marmoricola sp.]
MSAVLIFIILAVAILVIGLVVGLVALVNGRKQPPRRDLPPSAPTGTITEERPPEAPEEPQAPVITVERPEGTAGRLVRLRQRLSRSQGGLGRGLLLLLSRDRLDEDTWEEIEDTLITADVGVAATQELVERLRTRMRVEGVDASDAATVLREELLALVDPAMDRTLATAPSDGKPAVVLVVGVNGAGKTTSVGKLARVLVAEDKSVVLGAADTFRAAATEQLSTWGERVGVDVVTGPEGSDPASVAFESVRTGVERGVDVVVIDT